MQSRLVASTGFALQSDPLPARSTKIVSGSRPLKVKFILPALKEATDPQWRPIKYSLFPPLGLATLAA